MYLLHILSNRQVDVIPLGYILKSALLFLISLHVLTVPPLIHWEATFVPKDRRALFNTGGAVIMINVNFQAQIVQAAGAGSVLCVY